MSAIRNSVQLVDLHTLFLQFSLDAATETLFGKSAGSLTGNRFKEESTFAASLNHALKYVARRERLRSFYWLLNGANFRRSCDEVHRTLEQIINTAAHENHIQKQDGFSALEHIQKQVKDGTAARDEILNLLFAARDTSASLIDWIFYVLAREPDVRKRIQGEIRKVLPDASRPPTTAELARLTYLDNVIAEVLRMFPPVPLNGRLCVQDTTLPTGGGPDGEAPIVVPRGTWLSYSVYALHHSPRLYGPDARQFRPGRWESLSMKDRTVDWSWAPFNGGPRKCLGERYAWKQAKYLTVRLLQNIKSLNTRENEPDRGGGAESWTDTVKYQVDFVMTPHGGNWVQLKLGSLGSDGQTRSSSG